MVLTLSQCTSPLRRAESFEVRHGPVGSAALQLFLVSVIGVPIP